MKDAVFQMRMDEQVKEKAEKLYRDLGTSFQEAVRVFAVQSLMEGGYPFIPRVYQTNKKTAMGVLSSYGSDEKRKTEEIAFENAMVKKYA